MIQPFLSDGTVSLRPVVREDLRVLADWRNQPDIRMRTREWRPLTEAHQARWWERITAENTRDFMFTVNITGRKAGPRIETEWASMCGVVGLCHWSPIDRTAEVSFYIGDEANHRKGYTRAALRLLHGWAWSIGLDRVYAEVFAFNTPSIALLKSLGYRQEGRLRQHIYRNGRRWDSILLGVLREEWA